MSKDKFDKEDFVMMLDDAFNDIEKVNAQPVSTSPVLAKILERARQRKNGDRQNFNV